MPYYTINRNEVQSNDFFTFWSKLYTDPQEKRYHDNIGQPLTEERWRALFSWKNRTPYNRNQVEIFVNRLDALNALPNNTTAQEFLQQFNQGGPIFRIFFLHCWKPQTYPIFDQHVFRAMMYTQNQQIAELDQTDKIKIGIYLNDCIPFIKEIRRHNPALNLKTIDEALFVFGKFLKSWSAIF